MCSADIFLGLLAILFPPLAVWVKCGICSADSVINILLCMLGYIPGLIHAWYIIAKYPEPDYDYQSLPQNTEGGRVTYVFVHADDRQNRRQPKPQPGMNYGTTGSGNNAAASSSSAPPAPAPAPASASQAQQSQNGNAGEGRSDAPPPSYAQVVAGDHKVQSQE